MKTKNKLISIVLVATTIFAGSYFPAKEVNAAPLVNTGAPSGFQLSTFATGLFLPTTASFAPDGRLFIAQKNGVVRIFKNGTLLSQPFYTIASVNNYVDRGLLGMALDPNFSSNGYVYLLFTYDNNPANQGGPKTGRLIRVTAVGDQASAASEVTILGNIVGSPAQPSCENFAVTADCLPADSLSHAPGSVRFAPDGKMFVSIGDGAGYDAVDPLALRAQNLDSLAGKILRINPDGTAPADNPFYNNNPNSNRSKVWAYGVRNSFRLNVRESDGAVFLGDVGWNMWEEVNHAAAGSNLGWPCYEGNIQQDGDGQPAHGKYKDLPACQALYQNPGTNLKYPLHIYPHPPSSSIIGGVFYTGSNYPAAYQNTYFYADYSKNQIYNLKVDANNNLVAGSAVTFASNVNGAVDVFKGPEGDIFYVAINTGSINRITYSAGNQAPIAIAGSDKVSGALPLTVNFSSSGSSDPENGPIGYSWDFGDGSAVSTVANPSHTYTVNGTYNATLTISDDHSNTSTATVTIYAGINSPVVTINSPASFAQYAAGQEVNFSGSAFDPQTGVMPASSLNWQAIVHHCPLNDCHNHFLLNTTGASGTFVFPAHEKPFYIELVLSATNSAGLSSSKSVSIYPEGEPINHAVSFDGVNDYAITATAEAFKPQQMTVETWFHSLTTDTYGGELVTHGNNWGLRLLPDGNIRYFFNSVSGWKNFETTGLNLKDGVWHQVSAVRSATGVKIFSDGILRVTFSNSDQILYNLGVDLVVGKHGQTDDNFAFNGTIDETRFWNTARGDADIVANYNKVIATNQSGLVGYWRFEEGTGNSVADLTGNNHGLTLTNGPVFTAGIPLSQAPVEEINKAISFTSGAFGSVSNTTDLKINQFTVETWVKASGIGLYGGEVVTLGNNWGVRILWDGNLRFYTRNSTGWDNYETAGVNVLDNNWHHLAISRGLSNSVIYVDGVATLTVTNTNPTIVYSVANDLILGKHGSGDANFNLTGIIDEVRIWNSARSYAEITSNKNVNINPQSAGLLTYLKANEGSGLVVADATGKGHTAVLSASISWVEGAPLTGILPSGFASVSLDGIDDQVFIADSTNYSLQTFTLETWVKVEGLGIYGGEVASAGNNWGVRILPDGNIRFFFHTGGVVWTNLETTGLNLNDNAWHQISISKSPTQVKIYVDGVLRSTFANTQAIVYSLGPNLVLGRHGRADNRFNLRGSLDEFRFWNIVRTDIEITSSFQTELVLPQDGLVGYWKFNENSGTLAAEAIFSNQAVLQNGVVWGPSFPQNP